MWRKYLKKEIDVAITTSEYTSASAADISPDATGQIAAIIAYLKTTTCLPDTFAEAIHDALTNKNEDDLNNLLLAIDTSGLLTEAMLAYAPNVNNIEDESDLPFIIKMLTERMNLIRKCQITNDREQQRIQYVRETSECNQAFHQVEFDRLTGFEESEVQARYAMGVKMSSDLDELHKEHSVSKQTFFNDITLKGCCW